MSTKFNFDSDAVRKLAEIIKETDLTEIEYEAEGNRIYVSRQKQFVATHNQAVSAPHPVNYQNQPQTVIQSEDVTATLQKHPGLIRSPMVGTAYLAPEPGAATFVKIGDNVSAGQILIIVEAMKVMNPIKAPKAGKVMQIFCKDKAPIEYDEPLIIIE